MLVVLFNKKLQLSEKIFPFLLLFTFDFTLRTLTVCAGLLPRRTHALVAVEGIKTHRTARTRATRAIIAATHACHVATIAVI